MWSTEKFVTIIQTVFLWLGPGQQNYGNYGGQYSGQQQQQQQQQQPNMYGNQGGGGDGQQAYGGQQNFGNPQQQQQQQGKTNKHINSPQHVWKPGWCCMMPINLWRTTKILQFD